MIRAQVYFGLCEQLALILWTCGMTTDHGCLPDTLVVARSHLLPQFQGI